MSKYLYSSLSQGRWSLFLTLLVVLCTFTVHTDARASVDKYSFNKRERVHSKDTSLWNSLLKRDDDPYSCSADRPCSNGACCGKDGWCGYAPEYCGDGCLANCDAKAACGQYAEVPGATCPINVCCSEFGFCGTTEDFCGTGCQNGCEQPGPGAAWGGDVRDIVIGYYEAWTAGAAGCGGSVADEIPVQGLTHLFFSFGFIEPDTYNIIPMPGISESVFIDVVNTKKRNPDLKVYIALGGWTFNDNGTIWQPVFSDLVSTQAKRAKFIIGLLSFLSEWGFDGVDFDWEYPGAGDRGGQEDDGVNFTAMLKELQEAMNSGLESYGVTFTAPTSFWYLQHFDLEAMMQYVDWMNMMSYDLHGEWDAQNPIGARVLAHTNLTEINLALNLMWRNNVPPSQIVMGFGFYGRTFTLEDSTCTQPGCAFVGGGAAGPCTNTAGYLSYKEIGLILESKSVFTTYAETDAVKYFTYDSVNWVSYDDQTTLKQKVDFASGLGLRGLMIWAIDLDDDDNTALKSLLYPRTIDWAYPSNSTNSTNSSGIAASSMAPTKTTVEVPGSTQTGIVSGCNKYHLAVSGDYCYGIWTTYGITAAQFQAWNPATGSDTAGADCSVWLGYAYCVGVSSSEATITSGVISSVATSLGASAGATSGAASLGTSGGASAVATSGAASLGTSGGASAGTTSGAASLGTSGGASAGATSGAASLGTSGGASAVATSGAASLGTSGGASAGTTSGAASLGTSGGASAVATSGAASVGTSGGASAVATSGAASVGTSGGASAVATSAGAASSVGTSGGASVVATSVAAASSVVTSGATSVAATSGGIASSVATPTSSAAVPGPTQAGTISSCGKWHFVVSGDYCYSVWQTYGITGAQFYQWNTGTGADVNGNDCSLWLGYAYCVGL